jgi:hypothetical protein
MTTLQFGIEIATVGASRQAVAAAIHASLAARRRRRGTPGGPRRRRACLARCARRQLERRRERRDRQPDPGYAEIEVLQRPGAGAMRLTVTRPSGCLRRRFSREVVRSQLVGKVFHRS